MCRSTTSGHERVSGAGAPSPVSIRPPCAGNTRSLLDKIDWNRSRRPPPINVRPSVNLIPHRPTETVLSGVFCVGLGDPFDDDRSVSPVTR